MLLKMSQHSLSDSKYWRAIGQLQEGRSESEVSRALNIRKNTISRIWIQFCSTEEFDSRKGQDHPNTIKSSEVTVRKYSQIKGRKSKSNKLKWEGYYGRQPLVCINLTPSTKKARLNWSHEHLLWSQDKWAKVLFMGVSRYTLDWDPRRTIVLRGSGISKSGRKDFHKNSLLVWGGIILNSRTDLHIFPRGTITSQSYRDEVLHPIVRLFRGAVGQEFCLMDNNTRLYRDCLVQEYLDSENIIRMYLPSYSTDFNPIEQVFDALGHRVAERQPAPMTLLELKSALLQEWQLIPQELIDGLITSIESRYDCCIAVLGDHTPY